MSIVFSAINILNNAKEYLVKIGSQSYAEKQSLLSGSSIGEHTRHFIEFFQCLLSQANDGICLNYDQRLRNSMIETDPAFAISVIEDIQVELQELPSKVDIKAFCNIKSKIDEFNSISIPTTIERELLYNIEHTIHHLAIIKIGLSNVDPSLSVSTNFGVSNSTIEFRNQKSTQFVEKN